MKRSLHLTPLAQDHYQGLQASRRLRAGVAAGAGGDALAAYVAAVWEDHLAAHFRQEEEHLSDPLDRSGGAALRQRLLDEHVDLQARIEALRSGSSDPAAFEAFADALRSHIRFEDRELFPYLEDRLPPDDLAALGATLRATHPVPEPAWPTPSWEGGDAAP
jgi:hypothetical protein